MKSRPNSAINLATRNTMTPNRFLAAFAAASLFTAYDSIAQTLFSNSFDADTTASWAVNAGAGTHLANFFFDYSTVGIPSAPNSVGGTTRGLRMAANTAGGVGNGISVSPTGQSFTGDYRLTFDMWANVNGPLDTGGSGSTQLTTAGIGTSGTTAQHFNAAPDSVWFGVTGEGGAGDVTGGDYRAYIAGLGLAGPSNGVYAAGTSLAARNDTHAYYAGLGGQSAPAAQLALFPQQTNTTRTGTAGMAWRDVVIEKVGNTVTWTLDGRPIATVDVSGVPLAGSNIFFGQSDINPTTSADPNAGSLIFGLIDNVQVVVVPEPSTIALGAIGAASLLLLRRRKR